MEPYSIACILWVHFYKQTDVAIIWTIQYIIVSDLFVKGRQTEKRDQPSHKIHVSFCVHFYRQTIKTIATKLKSVYFCVDRQKRETNLWGHAVFHSVCSLTKRIVCRSSLLVPDTNTRQITAGTSFTCAPKQMCLPHYCDCAAPQLLPSTPTSR